MTSRQTSQREFDIDKKLGLREPDFSETLPKELQSLVFEHHDPCYLLTNNGTDCYKKFDYDYQPPYPAGTKTIKTDCQEYCLSKEIKPKWISNSFSRAFQPEWPSHYDIKILDTKTGKVVSEENGKTNIINVEVDFGVHDHRDNNLYYELWRYQNDLSSWKYQQTPGIHDSRFVNRYRSAKQLQGRSYKPHELAERSRDMYQYADSLNLKGGRFTLSIYYRLEGSNPNFANRIYDDRYNPDRYIISINLIDPNRVRKSVFTEEILSENADPNDGEIEIETRAIIPL